MTWRWLFGAKSGKVFRVRTTGLLDDSTIPSGDPQYFAETYPFVSLPVTLRYDPANPQMSFEGGPVTVEFLDASGNILNTVKVTISNVPLPIPRLHPEEQFWAFHKTGIFGDGEPGGRFVNNGPVMLTTYDDKLKDESLVTQYDTVQTWILPHGDNRLAFGPDYTGAEFEPVPPAGPYPNLRHMLSDVHSDIVLGHCGDVLLSGDLIGSASKTHWTPILFPKASYPGLNEPWRFFDWDTGSPMPVTDGPLINKPDEGSIYNNANTNQNPFSLEYTEGESGTQAKEYHSANRQIPSAIMFGSLPTGIIEGKPWQTLLFRPDPGGHPGAQDPPDHLLLDLFWMPVVEPYAISEPFSTAGKINMNYQMVPFTYIERSTGLHALLMNEELYAVPAEGWTAGYGKRFGYAGKPGLNTFSRPLDVEETLVPFRQKVEKGEVFLTPSEITELFLVPQGEKYSSMPSFWHAHRLTGENIRERAYATLYPRLTTKSNVFNVHYRVQTLRKRPGTPPDVWDESRDRVVAELRGNAVIERFLDINRTDLPDFATDPSATAESLYRFRILSSKEFNP